MRFGGQPGAVRASDWAVSLCTPFIQELNDLARQCILIFNFTFPYRQYRPPLLAQAFNVPLISFSISADFFFPILPVLLRNSVPSFTFVSMPETTINKDNFLSSRKH